MVGTCRRCKRILSYEEARCPYCGTDRPIELPWEAGRRRAPRAWPRALRRWAWIAAASLALLLLLVLCSAGGAR